MHKSTKSPDNFNDLGAVYDIIWFLTIAFLGVLESVVLKITESLKIVSLKLKLNSYGI